MDKPYANVFALVGPGGIGATVPGTACRSNREALGIFSAAGLPKKAERLAQEAWRALQDVETETIAASWTGDKLPSACELAANQHGQELKVDDFART